MAEDERPDEETPAGDGAPEGAPAPDEVPVPEGGAEAPEGAAEEAPVAAEEPGPAEEPAPAEPPAEETAPAAEEPAPAAEEPEPAAEEPEPAAEEPAPEPAAEEPAPEPAAEEPAPVSEEAVSSGDADPGAEVEGPPAEEPAAEESTPAEPAAEAPPPADAAPARGRAKRARGGEEPKEEVVPGAHLEPDIVLEDGTTPSSAYDEDAPPEEGAEAEVAPEPEQPAAPVAVAPRELAADARYRATGKRKTAVARVILRPGEGSYTVNGRPLDEMFPRVTLQTNIRRPLETAGYESRMDVVAKIHGGGVSSQAGALRHGIAKALIEADPNLRGELKRRGFLTRDPRVKERKKAGLKKARKRPQFSKR